MSLQNYKLTSQQYQVEDIDAFADLAYEKGWTDGMPVFPPTLKKVTAIIDYLKRPPDEALGIVSPGEGVATIEKIAINCAMAGCKPEYVPVVLAALEAILDPNFHILSAQCSTFGGPPLAIISGPVVKKLGFNHSEGALGGSGHRVNATIGRAIRLILWNIGQGKPGELSKTVFGGPARWHSLIAERPREEGNPWDEFHVDYAGLNAQDSAVSMLGANGKVVSCGFAASSIDDNISTIANDIKGDGVAAAPHVFVLNPQGAKILADAGWSKERFRDAVYEHCYVQVRDIKKVASQASPTSVYYWMKRISPDNDDAKLFTIAEPSHLKILVSGGFGGSHVCYHFRGSTHSLTGSGLVTKKINWNWD